VYPQPDNGTALISIAILRWSKERKVELHSIAPGKQCQNGFSESCSARLRVQFLYRAICSCLPGAGSLGA
jgi:putative transposase